MTKSCKKRKRKPSAQEKWEQKSENSVGKECIHSRPHIDPSWGKLLRTYVDHICDWKRHTFRHIHMQNHNHRGTKRKNKTGLQQRYRPGVGDPRFKTLTLKAFWAFSWGGRWGGWVRAVRASFLLANHSRGWGHVLFSAIARQSWPFHTQSQTPASDLTHPTPWVPNPVTLSPNTLSPTPKDSYAPSLTFSAPICQNHNLYTSPLITKQEKYHLKINLS